MKKLVIIGGGFAGSLVVKSLENRFQTTLIDNKNYFEFTPGILRIVTSPEHKKKIRSYHGKYLTHSQILAGEVTNITDKYVLLNNLKIPFDYLVIATGSKYKSSLENDNLILAHKSENLTKNLAKINSAKNIIIIGGGLTGVELAAEFCTKHLNKNITIIHSKENLIERNELKSIKKANTFLKKHDVKIIFNERAEKIIDNNIITNKGTKIPLEICFFCTGVTPNSLFMKPYFQDSLNEKNKILVNSSLQIEGHKNIFAGGDVTAIQEEKTAQSAERHAKIIIQNILNLENNRPLITYKTKKRPMLISLGKYDGILEYRSIVLTGLIPALIKSIIEFKGIKKRK